MISKAFQNILTQMAEVFPKKFGIADSQGLILASHGTEPNPELIDDLIYSVSGTDTLSFKHGYTIKAIAARVHPDFFVYVEGTDEVAQYCCSSIAVTISNVRYYYDEKYDKTSFIQNIIFDNLLPFDIHQKAKELHVDINTRRAVFYIKVLEKGDKGIFEVVSNMFPDKETDFIINIDEDNIVLIKQLRDSAASADLDEMAHNIANMLSAETMAQVLIGIGTIAEDINSLNHSYKESQIAIEVGKVFDEEKYILNYENLGIGRLIYQLPIKLCELFLREVFKKGDITSLDEETILTINKFFENDLNVSETSRQLFVHRNTLVYRLEKICKLTGLDLRKFDQAIVFKVAMMVHKYLISNPMKI